MVTVTEIISEVFRPYEGFKPDDWYLQRGTQVHTCCSALLLGKKIKSYDPRIEGYIKAFEKFVVEQRPVVLEVEKRIESVEYQFSGKPDLICAINKKHVVVDWKCGFSGYELIQLAGYGILTGVELGMAVLLKADGTYTIQGKGAIDISKLWKRRFLAALTVFNTMKEIKGGC